MTQGETTVFPLVSTLPVDSVEKITLRDENYPVHKINFAEKDIDI